MLFVVAALFLLNFNSIKVRLELGKRNLSVTIEDISIP